MDAPSATISIASHNRLPLLQEAVASALAQSTASFEVLVVDDGSDPETRAWLEAEALRHDRLRVILQDHAGVARARQRGVDEARGEFVCILDSDDRIAPDGLQQILDVFDAFPDTDLVYTNNRHLLTNGETEDCRYPTYLSNDDMVRATFLRPRCPFKHSGTTFRRSVALELGGYDVDLPIKIDIAFFLKFLTGGKRLRLLEEPIVEFRMHADSMSSRRALGTKAYWLLIGRYGPSNRAKQVGYFAVRAFWEMTKGLYLRAKFWR